MVASGEPHNVNVGSRRPPVFNRLRCCVGGPCGQTPDSSCLGTRLASS